MNTVDLKKFLTYNEDRNLIEVSALSYTDYYYEMAFGYYPFETLKEMKATQKAIDYLVDNHTPKNIILDALNKLSLERHNELSPEILVASQKDVLYKDSLLQPNVYYYHDTLKILSKPPVVDIFSGTITVEKNFIEMKIAYTIKDLCQYAYEKLRIPFELRDEKRDIGSCEYLLKNYKKITICEPIDFVLFLIDEASIHGVTHILKVSDFEQEVFSRMSKVSSEFKSKGLNQIVWR